MNPVCVAIYDKKAQVFQHPLFVSDLATAERSFVQIFASRDTIISQWPEDYDLYHLGSVMPGTGELVPLDHPSLVITGQSAVFAADRYLRQRGSELSRGLACPTPSEDSAASAERNNTPSDGHSGAVKAVPTAI